MVATLLEVATHIKRWAMKNQMFSEAPGSAEPDMVVIRQTFGAVGVPNVTKVLQNRGIAYIWIDDQDGKIIICTEKKLTARDEKALYAAAYHAAQGETFRVEFLAGNVAHIGGNPGPPSVPPYYLHNDRYSCGSSVYIASHRGAGTLGCLVVDAAGTLHGLSNNHVTGGCNYAAVDLPILAPGLVDVAAGQKDPETIGHHAQAYPFIDGLPGIVDATGNFDAAIFKIADSDRVTSMQQKHFDTPTSIKAPVVGMEVEKVGRTTGRTKGQVIARSFGYEPVLYDLDVIGGRKKVYFPDIYVVMGKNGAFAEGGDSGSLITHVDADGNRHAVGLLFAGTTGANPGLTFIAPIDKILNHFGVSILAGHNT